MKKRKYFNSESRKLRLDREYYHKANHSYYERLLFSFGLRMYCPVSGLLLIVKTNVVAEQINSHFTANNVWLEKKN